MTFFSQAVMARVTYGYVSARVEANDASSNVMPTQVGIHASHSAPDTEACVEPRLRGDDFALAVL
ncbi:MAG TPA: hypothetical protein VJ740_00665 [Hyphomicrobiaceae bacterium]|nr:hypothetical protein [Hyphomicrobiaceae bacterium]